MRHIGNDASERREDGLLDSNVDPRVLIVIDIDNVKSAIMT